MKAAFGPQYSPLDASTGRRRGLEYGLAGTKGGSMSQDKHLSLKEALEDFGWLPLTLLSIGGAISLIDIAELLADGLTLITPFEVVLRGYRRVTEAIGALVEPHMQPFIKWLSAAFDWELQLQPFWRSLFVLGMLFVLGIARAQWRGGQWGRAILYAIVMGLGVLAGSVAAAMLPPAGAWWVQGVMSAAPLALICIPLGIANAVLELCVPPSSLAEAWRKFVTQFQFAAIFGALGFAAGAGLSFLLGEGAGPMALGAAVAGIGAILLSGGLSDADRDLSRMGLAMLGGFVAAGMVLISNWALLALGVSAGS